MYSFVTGYFLLDIMFVKFIYIAVWRGSSFIFFAVSYFIMWINHSYLSILSLGGLEVVSNLCMLWIVMPWTLSYMYFGECISVGYMPRMELLGQMVCIPKGQLSKILLNSFQKRMCPFVFHSPFGTVCIFHFSHSGGCLVVSHWWFNLYFWFLRRWEYIFIWLLAICISSFVKCLFKSFAHISIE